MLIPARREDGRQLRPRPRALLVAGPSRQARPRATSCLTGRGESARPMAQTPSGHRRDRGRGQARADRRMDRPVLHLGEFHGYPRRRHRFHRPHAIGRAYRGAFNATPGADARRALARARDRARRDRSRRGRRCAVGRRAAAGRAGRQYRPPGRAARRLPGHRQRHDHRPPVLVGPDGDRHRRQAGHHRPHGCGRRRRAGIDQPGPDAGDARRRRSGADRDAQGRLHADAADRRDGRPALWHQPRRAGRICASDRSSAPPRRRPRPASTPRSCPSPRR